MPGLFASGSSEVVSSRACTRVRGAPCTASMCRSSRSHPRTKTARTRSRAVTTSRACTRPHAPSWTMPTSTSSISASRITSMRRSRSTPSTPGSTSSSRNRLTGCFDRAFRGGRAHDARAGRDRCRRARRGGRRGRAPLLLRRELGVRAAVHEGDRPARGGRAAPCCASRARNRTAGPTPSPTSTG